MLMLGLLMPVAGGPMHLHFCLSADCQNAVDCCDPCGDSHDGEAPDDCGCCFDVSLPDSTEAADYQLQKTFTLPTLLPVAELDFISPLSGVLPALVVPRGPPPLPASSIRRHFSVWRL